MKEQKQIIPFRPLGFALLIVLAIVPQVAAAGVKEYVRDYNYHAEHYDTESSCRANAIDGVRRELLDELGTYVGSVVQQKQDSLGNSYMSHDVVTIAAGIVALNVLGEKWSQPVYYVKASMKADPDDVLKQLKEMRANLDLENSLRESHEELERSRKEVAQLKAQLAQMEPLKVTATAKPSTPANSAAPVPPPAPGNDKLVSSYLRAVQDFEVEEATRRALAASARGDFASLAQTIRALAEKGYPKAQLRMGAIYERGHGVAQDYKTAREWYLKAMSNGVADAPARIGWLHEHGFGVEKDYGKAAEYYKRAIADGGALGYTHMGYLYESGKGVERNLEQAAEYYRTGMEKGNYLAMARLGFLYQRGLGVKQDERRSVELYKQAVEHGQPFAMARLGQMYNLGQGVARDHTKAMALIRESVRHKVPLSYALMGFMHENGWETRQSYDEAIRWYEKAAGMDAPFAEFRLGMMYKDGLGVSRNPEKAMYWFERAANKGDDRAAEILSRMSEKRRKGGMGR